MDKTTESYLKIKDELLSITQSVLKKSGVSASRKDILSMALVVKDFNNMEVRVPYSDMVYNGGELTRKGEELRKEFPNFDFFGERDSLCIESKKIGYEKGMLLPVRKEIEKINDLLHDEMECFDGEDEQVYATIREYEKDIERLEDIIDKEKDVFLSQKEEIRSQMEYVEDDCRTSISHSI